MSGDTAALPSIGMVIAGGVVGAVLGFAVSVYLTEAVFAVNTFVATALDVGATVAGWLIGSWLLERLLDGNAKPS
jgi:tetrahydromethanopterin S-methyltransferase subunit C